MHLCTYNFVVHLAIWQNCLQMLCTKTNPHVGTYKYANKKAQSDKYMAWHSHALNVFVSWCVGGSKASDCVTNQLLPGLQMVWNTVMSLIKNSVCPLIDQRPKAVPGHTFNEKEFPHNKASRTIHYVNTTSPM